MSEITDIDNIFHMLCDDHMLPLVEGRDYLNLVIAKAFAFYAKKPYQVDAFNALKESLESRLLAKQLIRNKSSEEVKNEI